MFIKASIKPILCPIIISRISIKFSVRSGLTFLVFSSRFQNSPYFSAYCVYCLEEFHYLFCHLNSGIKRHALVSNFSSTLFIKHTGHKIPVPCVSFLSFPTRFSPITSFQRTLSVNHIGFSFVPQSAHGISPCFIKL